MYKLICEGMYVDVCMYVCLCIYMREQFLYTHTLTLTHTTTYIHTCIHTCTHAFCQVHLKSAEKDKKQTAFKMCLLSGPPGLGKTTLAHVACK